MQPLFSLVILVFVFLILDFKKSIANSQYLDVFWCLWLLATGFLTLAFSYILMILAFSNFFC